MTTASPALQRTSPSTAAARARTHRLLGVEVEALDVPGLCARIAQAVDEGPRQIIGNHNLHSVHLYHRDDAMRRFCDRAACVFVDGMPLVWVARLLGLPITRSERLTAIDWLRPVLTHARDLGWRVFFLGSRPGVAERAALVLRTEIEGLQLATHHGYFDPTRGGEENDAVLAEIRRVSPQLLIVGMGMPRQERWVMDNLDEIAADVIMNQGAFLDYVAGAVPTPPRWLARHGGEWLARLVADPRRLWRRYLVEPWQLLPLLLRDLRRRPRRARRS